MPVTMTLRPIAGDAYGGAERDTDLVDHNGAHYGVFHAVDHPIYAKAAEAARAAYEAVLNEAWAK